MMNLYECIRYMQNVSDEKTCRSKKARQVLRYLRELRDIKEVQQRARGTQMTFRKLYEKAERDLSYSRITLGEYMAMTAPLDEAVVPDSSNKMKRIAAMYGKELKQPFEVFGDETGFSWVMFTKDGLKTLKGKDGPELTRQNFDEYSDNMVDLEDLLTGVYMVAEDEENEPKV